MWDTHKSVYNIVVNTTLKVFSESQYFDLSGNSQTVESPDVDSDEFKAFLKDFAGALIETDTQHKWFASRLKESSLLKRLSHNWLTHHTVTSLFNWAKAEWAPTLLAISSKGYTLTWALTSFQKGTPKIPLRFLPPVSRPESPTAEVRQITLQPPSTDELEQVDIPFTTENTAHVSDEQMRDRNVLHEARLRLALAKLKEHRLSNTYYQKYGEVLTDEESDGESDESE